MDMHDAPPEAPSLKLAHTEQVFLCPNCDSELTYQESRVTGQASMADLHDYFKCPVGCGLFEHDRKTHHMRQIERED